MLQLTNSRVVAAEACGKAILTGEHFVVWGGTALAVPLFGASVKVQVNAAPASRNRVILENHGDDELLLKACRKACTILLKHEKYSLSVHSTSTFPIESGLGGSAAFSVALCRALLKALHRRRDDDLVAQSALDLERVFHGTPSGIDSTTIAFETPCYVKTGSQFLTHGAPDVAGPLAGFLQVPPGADFVLAYSGQRGNTREAIGKVRQLAETPGGDLVIQRLTAVAETISLQTASALRKADYAFVGAMMDENHLLLRALEVSTPKLDHLVNVAKANGALGAKLTGGGLGGFMLAVTWPDRTKRLVESLKEAGSPLVLTQSTDQYPAE